MKYDFDIIIDRKNTNSIKYDFAREKLIPKDILPLWVADMDFKTAPAIINRLKNTVEYGIYGYSDSKEDYYIAVSNWYEKHFGYKIKKSWIVKTPGVVFAIAMVIRALTNVGDGVLIQNPVYYPFSDVIRENERVLVNNSLVRNGNKYEIDFEDFERKIIENNVKLFILCSPHNPVGRVWKKWELKKLGDICIKHNVYVLSDEIHSDFVYPGYKHTMFNTLSEAYEKISITCTAPSKSFNLAGVQISNIIIPNIEIRKKIKKEIAKVGYSSVGIMGIVACQAAYEEGEEWLNELKQYIYSNLGYLRNYLEDNIPEIELVEPEGTYLVWLDCSKLGISGKKLEEFIIHKAGLWLDVGYIFGKEGDNYIRVNIACPKSILDKALNRLEKAVRELKNEIK
ncbi:MalY/PatB family protein [Eubacterium sp. AF19-12LB]|uniref:MalY/PatB family protein n=1 Tax=Eubacterium sp. AF19-12LB TaxID=2293106 RepID=UPI000E485D13|nr:MalY/PatB family protein [Eubacterium sp. AF19-12LB]RHR33345.1 pyridoxal phosphate-dependent aminotransferase [Eubacterium sp. AF19-12LB]